MATKRAEQQQRPRVPQQGPEKQQRFRIEKLEERIAPSICYENPSGKLTCHGPKFGKGW